MNGRKRKKNSTVKVNSDNQIVINGDVHLNINLGFGETRTDNSRGWVTVRNVLLFIFAGLSGAAGGIVIYQFFF